MRLAFVGLALVPVCWLAGVLVCLCALPRTKLSDGTGLSLGGIMIFATLGVAASNLFTS